MSREIGRNLMAVLTTAIAVAGATIVVSAIALRPKSCVEDKVKIAELTLQLADTKIARAELPFGVCVTYESERQKLCRATRHNGGHLSIHDMTVDGEMTVTEEVAE